MGRQQERSDALTALVVAQRAQKAALAAALVGVTVNTVSQPQIDAIVAAGVAYDAAILTTNAALRAAEAL